MKIPRLYFSQPSTVLPDTAVDNDEILAMVRKSFRGSDSEWQPIEQTIRFVFDRCNTKIRYLERDPKRQEPGAFAARAATACLERHEVAPSDVDLVIYGGIARNAFEPATASEVAGRLGITAVQAFDVTCACAGMVEALHTASAYFAMDDDLQTALICAGELTSNLVSYDIQTLADVAVGVAGLTLGNAAAAFLVTREPLARGGARIKGLTHKTLSEHYELCRAPIDGNFVSHSTELFALSVHAAPEIYRVCAQAGWTPDEVDHYTLHQPSEGILELIFSEVDARPQACVHTHSMFGNTASTAWAVALDYRMQHNTVSAGDKIVIGSAAAGFTVSAAAAEWVC